MAEKEDNYSDDVSNEHLLERAKREFSRDRKLVIKNLPAAVTEEEIKAFLEEYPVKDVNINKQQSQAIVGMEDSDMVPEAVAKLKDASLLYTPITLSVGHSDNMLCVAHLPLTLTEWMFRDTVSAHGNINKCFLMRSEETGESKGYGFVEYSEPLEKISQIKTKLDWSVVQGNPVHCDAVIDRTAHGLGFEDLHSRCLLINNLPLDYKDPIELREVFSKFNKPVYCQIVLKEGESLGFGIIEYAEAEEAETAFKEFSEQKINDTLINLSYCIPGMSAVHMFNRVMFKYGDKVKVNKASLHSDPVYPNPAFLKHNFFKLMVAKFPRLLVQFTDNLLLLQEGYVHQLETHTNAKPGILGPAPNIPMSPLMDMYLQLGLLSLVILDLKEKNELEGEIPEPLGKLKMPAKDEDSNKTELPSLLGDPMTAQADIVLKNILMPPNDVPDFPPREKSDEPCLLNRPMRKLGLMYVQSLGRLMAMMSENSMAKGILGNAPMGPPRPLMEHLVKPNLGNLQSPSKNDNSQGPPSLLGEIPGSNSLNAAANFMGAVKALAFQKLTETPTGNKNQILNALFGNQGNNQQSGGGGPQSLLGKPPPGMGFNAGQDRSTGDGLLGEGPSMRNEGYDYSFSGHYEGYDDQNYQNYGGPNDRYGMDQDYMGPDGPREPGGPMEPGGYGNRGGGYFGNNNYNRDGEYGRQGMDYGPGGLGGRGGPGIGGPGASILGDYDGDGRMRDRPYMSTPNRKNPGGGLYGAINSDGYIPQRNRDGGKDKEYDSIAQQAAAYAAHSAAAYNQYDNYKNYVSGYNSGYNNNNNSGYGDGYDSGYGGSGYSGQDWRQGPSYGSYGGGGQGYNNANTGYGRGSGGPSSGPAGGSSMGNQGYGDDRAGPGYGRSGPGTGYGGSGSNFTGTSYGQEPSRPANPGGYSGGAGTMRPPLPPGPAPDNRHGFIGTPQGQKRNSNHFVPSPEPSPEGDYIGQHSQGLGGHYADTYAKRQRLNSRFGAY